MNHCIWYILTKAGMTLCTRDAPFLWHGSSYCREHIAEAISGRDHEDWRNND